MSGQLSAHLWFIYVFDKYPFAKSIHDLALMSEQLLYIVRSCMDLTNIPFAKSIHGLALVSERLSAHCWPTSERLSAHR